MKHKKLWLGAFVLVALVQLYVPAQMIWQQENVLTTGTEYRFRTAPIDPYDPFRGKYITLSFRQNRVAVPADESWTVGESVYATLATDSTGFAEIAQVTKTAPTDTKGYLKVRVRNIYDDKMTIRYPFERYYMEESKAYDAEVLYRESRWDEDQVAYALVSVSQGDAVLKDVLIDDVPIRELVETKQQLERE
ncbi:MAG: GDYXXLXY domain-containing protein [Bacteroidota bacterium]